MSMSRAPLTLESVIGQDCFGKTYTGSHVNTSIFQPWTLFGFGATKNEVKFSKTNDNIDIKFSHNKNDGKISFTKAQFEAALNNPKNLQNGEYGISISDSVVCNSLLANMRTDGLFFNLLFGSGMGVLAVEMIFDKNNRLDRMKITKNYKGEEILFITKHLKSDFEIRQEQQMIRQKREQERQQAHDERQFKF